MAVGARRSALPIDPALYTIGGIAPQRVTAPTTIGALSRAVREAHAADERIVFAGGTTLLGIGRTPTGYDAAISLSRMNRVLDYEPRDLTISVEAGITIDALAKRLARNNQFVPFDAPLASRSTVGGVLAAGWHGPRSAHFGRPRDYVIGATVVLADGTISTSGGRTVKNVSGYDVAKLFIGSLGTLGAFARVNLKTLPRPQLERAALCRLPERTRERALAALTNLTNEPSAVLHIWGYDGEIDGRDGIDGRLLLLFEGSRDGVEHATRGLRSALGAAGVPETVLADTNAAAVFGRAVDAMIRPIADRCAIYRIGGLPSEIPTQLASVHALAATHELRSETIADVRGGAVWARISADAAAFSSGIRPYNAALRAACERVSLLYAPAEGRSQLEATSAPPASVAPMRELKHRFDPKGTLAPGRLFDGF